MSDRPTAGQASLEYVAALALLAAVFAVAAPAVGAPDLGGLVVGKLRLALCLVANDVCSDRAAREAGLAPCPLRSDVTGYEVSATVLNLDVGHGWTLHVTRRSDGSVSIVRTAKGHGGVTADTPHAGGSFGPVAFERGGTAGARGRVQVARAWQFPDQASAARFLAHPVRNALDERAFPAAWHSVEGAGEIAAAVGAAAGARGYRERGQIAGLGGSADAALGARLTRERMVTLYGRVGSELEVSVPFVPSPFGSGRDELIVEYTFGSAGPRELAFRHGDSGAGGDRLTETVMRLDLRDPDNLAAARRLVAARLPWGPAMREHVEAVLGRIRTHGTVERTVSAVDDGSWGASGSVSGGVKFGAAAKLIKVRRRLREASAWTGGPYPRERLDCQR